MSVLDALDVLDLLAGLVDKSLVFTAADKITIPQMTVARSDETRYGLQETMRQYGLERLRQSGEEQSVRRQHRDAFLRLAERARPEMQGPGQTLWLNRLEEEHDNLCAALDWCLQEPDGAQMGLQLASDLFFLWWIRGYFAEGQRRYAAALGRPEAQARTTARAKALSRAGSLLTLHGDAAAARPLFEEGLAIAREQGDRKAEANLLCNLGDISIDSDPASARAMLEESLALHQEIGNRSGLAHTLMLLGNVALKRAHLDEAQLLYAESLALNRALGNPQKTGHALWCLARGCLSRGDFEQASTLLEECAALFRRSKDPWGLSAALALAGEAALQKADFAAARRHLGEHLRLVSQMGMKRSAPWVLRALGRLAAARGQWARQVRLFATARACEAHPENDGIADPDSHQEAPPTEVPELTAARAALGEGSFLATWSAGYALTLKEASEDAVSEKE